jgi:hypothetical protein
MNKTVIFTGILTGMVVGLISDVLRLKAGVNL